MNLSQHLPKVSVVIPYFQRESGILSRAIRSVLAQSYPGEIHIVVVDDGSPVPAHGELSWFDPAESSVPRHLEIVTQENAGPAVARNTGLDRIDDSDGFLAFLDSDDTWLPEHIERAVAKLNTDKDFYFSDYLPINRRSTAFQRDGFKPDEHGLPLGDECFTYNRDFFDQTIRNNVVGTSTVVLRIQAIQSQRFMPEYQYAGEDHIFWLGVSMKTNRIVVSNNCEVEYDRGVNIYESGKTLATPKTFRRISNELRFRKSLPTLFGMDAAQLARNNEIIFQLRTEFAMNSIHALKTTPLLGLRESLSFLRSDLTAFHVLASEIVDAFRRRACGYGHR